jgi:hypothetical protein
VSFLLLVCADVYVTPSLNKFLSPEPVWHEALLWAYASETGRHDSASSGETLCGACA